MHLVELLRELRLLKGQQDYRYLLAWLVVLVQLVTRPVATIFLAWLALGSGLDLRLARALLALIPHVGRSIGS